MYIFLCSHNFLLNLAIYIVKYLFFCVSFYVFILLFCYSFMFLYFYVVGF